MHFTPIYFVALFFVPAFTAPVPGQSSVARDAHSKNYNPTTTSLAPPNAATSSSQPQHSTEHTVTGPGLTTPSESGPSTSQPAAARNSPNEGKRGRRGRRPKDSKPLGSTAVAGSTEPEKNNSEVHPVSQGQGAPPSTPSNPTKPAAGSEWDQSHFVNTKLIKAGGNTGKDRRHTI